MKLRIIETSLLNNELFVTLCPDGGNFCQDSVRIRLGTSHRPEAKLLLSEIQWRLELMREEATCVEDVESESQPDEFAEADALHQQENDQDREYRRGIGI